ncbi:hypothetical protein [Rhizobium leguminosarum]|uniref:hypothetical protein n=1 Tax=Rhizobium leguminosarum TaxID=384 RepID=UPI003F9617C7
MKLLYENGGLTDALFRTFLVYVACSPRPARELLSPSLSPLDEPFAQQFFGMTTIPVTLDELAATRERLIADIRARLADKGAQKFLLSLHDGAPNFDALGLPQAAALPAVQWKLVNCARSSQKIPRNIPHKGQSLKTSSPKGELTNENGSFLAPRYTRSHAAGSRA